MGITSADRPKLLDLTRLVSRAGRRMTGIDRVEYAYLEHFLDLGPVFGLVRTRLGFILLDRRGCTELRDRVAGGEWARASGLAGLVAGDPQRAAAESALRCVALSRCLPPGLGRMLRRHLPDGTCYFNTGHSNLGDRVLASVRRIRDARIAVLLHDTIPLDFPQFQRPGSVDRFRKFLSRAATADLLICNSQQTQEDMRRHLPAGVAPHSVVAPLGVDVRRPDVPPDGAWRDAAYFVALGTIEPRKNIGFLLDLWETEGIEAHLLICGARGWNSDEVFARLDAGIPRVHELNGLSDGQIAGLLKSSAGLLFPSLAEGYGLPPVEAAALGVPVLSNSLPTVREALGDIPIYASVSDRYLWSVTIKRMAEDHLTSGDMRSAEGVVPPGWSAHFKVVLTMV